MPVGRDPNQLALSSDSAYLYVGLDGDCAVRRIDLATMTPGPTFTLGVNARGWPQHVMDIAGVPGSPDSVVVARGDEYGYPSSGVVVYDNGVARPLAGALSRIVSSITSPSKRPAR